MSPGSATVDPGAAFDSFLLALERRELRVLAAALCRDVCFLTPDRTPISGRDRVTSLLAQLLKTGLSVNPGSRRAIQLADFALLSIGLQLHLPAQPRPLVQSSEATIAFVNRESRWKLLLIAPWGWP